MKDIETLIGDLQEDYDLLTYDKEQESRDYDDVSVCVATNPNGVDCATPVELPTFKSRSSFCPLKELKD